MVKCSDSFATIYCKVITTSINAVQLQYNETRFSIDLRQKKDLLLSKLSMSIFAQYITS